MHASSLVSFKLIVEGLLVVFVALEPACMLAVEFCSSSWLLGTAAACLCTPRAAVLVSKMQELPLVLGLCSCLGVIMLARALQGRVCTPGALSAVLRMTGQDVHQ